MGLRDWLGSAFNIGGVDTEEDSANSSKDIEPKIELGENFADLTQFQRDLLILIGGMETPSGLEIKEEIGLYFDKEVHHGRLYPNLDTLAEERMITKEEVDDRTNAYTITEYGSACFHSHRR